MVTDYFNETKLNNHLKWFPLWKTEEKTKKKKQFGFNWNEKRTVVLSCLYGLPNQPNQPGTQTYAYDRGRISPLCPIQPRLLAGREKPKTEIHYSNKLNLSERPLETDKETNELCIEGTNHLTVYSGCRFGGNKLYDHWLPTLVHINNKQILVVLDFTLTSSRSNCFLISSRLKLQLVVIHDLVIL